MVLPSQACGNATHTMCCVQDDLVDEVADIDTVPNEKKQHEVTAAISNSLRLWRAQLSGWSLGLTRDEICTESPS